MKKIIGIIKPFEAEKTLMVYEDGNKIDIAKATSEDLYLTLFELMEKHKTSRLDLVGPKKYLTGLANQIRQTGIDKYSLDEKDIEINII